MTEESKETKIKVKVLTPVNWDDIMAVADKYNHPRLKRLAMDKKMVSELEAVLEKTPDADVKALVDRTKRHFGGVCRHVIEDKDKLLEKLKTKSFAEIAKELDMTEQMVRVRAISLARKMVQQGGLIDEIAKATKLPVMMVSKFADS